MNLLDSKLLRKTVSYTIIMLSVVSLIGVSGSLFFKFPVTFVFIGIALMTLPAFVVGYFAYRVFVERLEEKTTEITESSRIHLATVEALATAIDARDQVGVGHVRRTQIYAVGIGEILGLSEADIQALRTGALLHDIGKLGVPDHILNKPGKLTPAEMEKMKIHSKVGASILERVSFPYPVVPTVKHHHERWDGTGYPNGLIGDKIPLTARILSVADTYDTLRGARPYRPAVSREDARRLLLSRAGMQFDPKIVDVFLRNLKKFDELVETEGLTYSIDNQSNLLHDTGNGDGELSYVHQIKNANREVFKLYELARIFGSAVNLSETFSLFTTKIAELVPYSTCVIYLSDELRAEAVAAFAAGDNHREIHGWKIRTGAGITGNVLKHRKPISETNPVSDFPGNNGKFAEQYRAMISLPLFADDKMLGAVSLYSTEIENYGEEHLRLLETICLIASDAINKSLRHAETETRAMTDPMTGLPNARSLQIHFEKEAARSKRKGNNFHLLMLDLDGFKAVNDNFGHKAGDKMLKEIACVISGQLRDYDFLARYAGDEFVAIIPETDELDIRDLCNRIEDGIGKFVLPVGNEQFAQVGVSIGTACFPINGESLDQIIIAADKAMYSVKDVHKRRRELANRKDEDSGDLIIEEILHILPENHDLENGFVVEVDESHIISSSAIN
ncbi:hypothetical protein BH20ACI4_BH20ACI4_14200 [soil metagenome]